VRFRREEINDFDCIFKWLLYAYTPQMSETDNRVPKTPSRWWEDYFVRYFVGTVIGAVVVVVLASHLTDSDLKPIFLDLLLDPKVASAKSLIVIAALGLAYCYIASAPMMVLHATRGQLFKETPPWFTWRFWTVVIGLFVALCLDGICFYFGAQEGSSHFSRASPFFWPRSF